jgi:predicted phage-related endonuclease
MADFNQHRGTHLISIDYEFDRVPGKYRLIQGEGSFLVSGHKKKGYVRFITGNDTFVDERKVLRNNDADFRIDLGWYSIVASSSLVQ